MESIYAKFRHELGEIMKGCFRRVFHVIYMPSGRESWVLVESSVLWLDGFKS